MTSINDLERVWDSHTAAEFVTCDVDATMATMTEDPVVLHVPTMVGARGRAEVRRFYADHFIKHQAGDLELQRVSRLAAVGGVVDELIISFTHDVPVPWILPGVTPTGRRIVVPLVTVIGMRDALIHSEHIYWDQASVLAQTGLIGPAGLPITGAEQARLVADEPGVPFNRLLA